LGSKDQDEVLHYLHKADIFIAPSVMAEDGDIEGTPTVIMEAQTLEIPIISTLHSGIPEVVEDGITGILVPERDVNVLADKITYLIDHKELWTDFGCAGRKHVEKFFDIDKLNDKLVEYYYQIIDNK
jgi:colanic acid/amylovoran biosynthesis glycosyltransferase